MAEMTPWQRYYRKNRNHILALHTTPKYRERSAIFAKAWRVRRKKFLEELKAEVGCQICGLSDPLVLTFHRVLPEEKSIVLNSMLSCKMDTLVGELEKCIVLCMNHILIVEEYSR